VKGPPKKTLDFLVAIWNTRSRMNTFSTRQVAKKLGLGIATLTRYITAKKVPAPKTTKVGDLRVRIWNEKDIERVRKLLPKIKNGRKFRLKGAQKKK